MRSVYTQAPDHPRDLFILIWCQIIRNFPNSTDPAPRTRCIRELGEASSQYGSLPTSYDMTSTLTEPGKQPFASGVFSHIWKLASRKDHSLVFAVKSHHAFPNDRQLPYFVEVLDVGAA